MRVAVVGIGVTALVAGEEPPAALGSGVVQEGRFAVLGDNPRRTPDSRHFGLLSTGQVVGVALRRIGRGAPDLR